MWQSYDVRKVLTVYQRYRSRVKIRHKADAASALSPAPATFLIRRGRQEVSYKNWLSSVIYLSMLERDNSDVGHGGVGVRIGNFCFKCIVSTKSLLSFLMFSGCSLRRKHEFNCSFSPLRRCRQRRANDNRQHWCCRKTVVTIGREQMGNRLWSLLQGNNSLA